MLFGRDRGQRIIAPLIQQALKGSSQFLDLTIVPFQFCHEFGQRVEKNRPDGLRFDFGIPFLLQMLHVERLQLLTDKPSSDMPLSTRVDEKIPMQKDADIRVERCCNFHMFFTRIASKWEEDTPVHGKAAATTGRRRGHKPDRAMRDQFRAMFPPAVRFWVKTLVLRPDWVVPEFLQ
ncbi:MAG: hypothetical protein ACK5Q5_10400 [Planctomycetaceae bacterium]